MIASSNEITGIRPLQLNNQQLALPDYSQSIGAFCGIGNPRSFFQQLVQGGHQVAWTQEFRDHYYYTQNDIDELCAEAARLNISALLTTAKDAVKLNQLQFSVPCFVVDIEMRFQINDQQILSELIRRAIGT
ncbi:MAG: tetraacyldisaccharide 4'-kinase [Pyrinomonadaceae bacterium]